MGWTGHLYADTLTPVEIKDLLTRAKGSSGLSVRALASSAQVATSTITRIQSGTVAPTVPMLDRIAEAAGFDLHVELRRRGATQPPRLGDLVDAWARRDGEVRLDWTRWRALLDHFALRPERIPDAIYPVPSPAGDPIIDALLAGVAEKLADDARLPHPAWCALAPWLDAPYRPPVLRRIPGRTVPRQLEDRGLLIDAESLWRNADTVGV